MAINYGNGRYKVVIFGRLLFRGVLMGILVSEGRYIFIFNLVHESNLIEGTVSTDYITDVLNNFLIFSFNKSLISIFR